MISFGVPLLLGGDELGRTQLGNNNAYCQDNPITRFDWENVDEDLLAFARRLVAFRLGHPVFRRRRFLSGADWRQLRWYTPAGSIVTGEQWADPTARAVAIYLEGQDAPDRAADGTLLVDDDFLVLVNAWWEPLDFIVPQSPDPQVWQAEIDTFDPEAERGKLTAGDRVRAGPRSVLVLVARSPRSTSRNGHARHHDQ